MITSLNLGIKGKLDLIAQCEYSANQYNTLQRAIIPLELKTGMSEDYAHNGQTIIYCLLLMQQHQQLENINGLLYYLRKNKLLNIKFKPAEVLNLLMRRNFLAKFVKNLNELPGKISFPPLITNNFECNKCHMNQICSLANQTLESETKVLNFRSQVVDLEEPPTFKAYGEVEESLTISKRMYFKRWIHLLQLEEDYQKREEKEKSTQTNENTWIVEMDDEESFRKTYLQTRRPQDDQEVSIAVFSKTFQEKEKSFLLLDQFKTGDYVVITESSDLCKIRGTIVGVNFRKTSKKACNEKLYILSLEVKYLLRDVEMSKGALKAVEDRNFFAHWKLQKIKKYSPFSLMRGNVAELILHKTYTRLSELLIEEKAPKYNDLEEPYRKLLQHCKIKYTLNQDQYLAVEKVKDT